MTVHELKNILDENNISEDIYEIPGHGRGWNDTTYHLKQDNGEWIVWFEERAEKSMQSVHNTESDACHRFIEIFYPKLDINRAR